MHYAHTIIAAQINKGEMSEVSQRRSKNNIETAEQTEESKTTTNQQPNN